MDLSNILDEIKKNEANSKIDIHSGPPQTYQGRVGMKRAAVENIERLKREYRKKLLETTVFVIVTGAHQDTFVETSSNETFGCFSADPDAFFSDMATRVDKTLYGRETTKNLFNIASNILEDKAMELDIASYPMLLFKEQYNKTVKAPEELVPILRRAVVDQVGSELIGLNAVYSLVDKAMEQNHTGPVTPVVLGTSDDAFALDLYNNLQRLSKNVFLVIAGKSNKTLSAVKDAMQVKTVNEEMVGQVLGNIRNKVVL